MKKHPASLLFVMILCCFVNHSKAQGLITREIPFPLEETVEKVKTNIESMGMTIIAHIDHSAAAAKNGLELSATQVLIFGNPKVGTLLMQEDPRTGLDLPLKMLIWNQAGRTFIGYRDPSFLLEHYNIGKQKEIVERMKEVLAKIAERAAEK